MAVTIRHGGACAGLLWLVALGSIRLRRKKVPFHRCRFSITVATPSPPPQQELKKP